MTPMPVDRLPPQSREAERGVLGAMLRDPDAIDDIARLLSEEDFYFDCHQRIFRAIAGIHASGKPVDLVLVHESLKRSQELADVGGVAYLAELWDLVPTAANAEYHAGIIRDCSLRRAVIHAANEAARDAFDGAAPGEDVAAAWEAKLFDLRAGRGGADIIPVREVVLDELQRLDDQRDEGGLVGISSGIRQLDAMTGGFRDGLYVVGARPSVGKSAMLLTFALNAVRHGTPCLFFSLEMNRRQLVQRHLAMLSGVNLRRLRGGCRLLPHEAEAIAPAAETLSAAPLFIADAMQQRARDILTTTRRAIRRHGIGIIFIDYLQLIEPENTQVMRVEQLGVITRRLKQLSGQAGIPVVAAAQVNRAAAGRESERPKLADFRESGSIEMDADDAYLLWRLDTTSGSDVEHIGLDVAKQRNGPTGEITLNYRRSCTRFEDGVPTL
jgi:replicative DNA helicase